MLKVSVAKLALPKSGALVLLLEEGGDVNSPTGELWRAADAATEGAIAAPSRRPSSRARRARP